MPAVAPLRSSGTFTVVHSSPFAPQGTKSARAAGAPLGAPSHAQSAVKTMRPRSRIEKRHDTGRYVRFRPNGARQLTRTRTRQDRQGEQSECQPAETSTRYASRARYPLRNWSLQMFESVNVIGRGRVGTAVTARLEWNIATCFE